MNRNTLRYVYGFSLSLALTAAAFGAAAYGAAGQSVPAWVVPLILLCAVAQLFVQLAFFLHLGDSKESARLNFAMLGFAGIIVIILVGGSVWIMSHLNHNMQPYNVFEKENISPDANRR